MPKHSAPPCGLYLKLPPDGTFEILLAGIRNAAFVINRSAYEQNMHIVEVDADAALDPVSQTGLVHLIKSLGLVAIVRGTVAQAKLFQADGVLLRDPARLAAARAELDDDKIIGLSCPLGRSEAETALKAGIDYVIFGDHEKNPVDPQLISWWAGVTEDPCVAGGAITNDMAGPYVRAGAAFIDCSDYVWQHPKGVLQGVTDMLYAIDLAAEKKSLVLN